MREEGGSAGSTGHDGITVAVLGLLLHGDAVGAGGEVRLVLRRESRRGGTTNVSSRALLFSPAHKRAPFYVRSSNPRAWDELCYYNVRAAVREDGVRALLQQSPRPLAIVGAHLCAPARLRLGHTRAAAAATSTCSPAGTSAGRP